MPCSPLPASLCHSAVAGEECHLHTIWAMEAGADVFKSWYPAAVLREGAHVDEFQAWLHHIHHGDCPRPCLTAQETTEAATQRATAAPTTTPTPAPAAAPTMPPTSTPPVATTAAPTASPTMAPTAMPTASPTIVPTSAPTPAPIASPTVAPTAVPTASPTTAPTLAPTTSPTVAPTPAPMPPAEVTQPGQETCAVCFRQCQAACDDGHEHVLYSECWGEPRFIKCQCRDRTFFSFDGCPCEADNCPV